MVYIPDGRPILSPWIQRIFLFSLVVEWANPRASHLLGTWHCDVPVDTWRRTASFHAGLESVTGCQRQMRVCVPSLWGNPCRSLKRIIMWEGTNSKEGGDHLRTARLQTKSKLFPSASNPILFLDALLIGRFSIFLLSPTTSIWCACGF